MIAVHDAAMIQDPTGAAVLVGGSGYNGGASSAIYRLLNAGSSWIQLSQTLQTGRYWHVAFLVPDLVVNCETKPSILPGISVQENKLRNSASPTNFIRITFV